MFAPLVSGVRFQMFVLKIWTPQKYHPFVKRKILFNNTPSIPFKMKVSLQTKKWPFKR